MALEIVQEHVKDVVATQVRRTLINVHACNIVDLQLIHDHLPHAGIAARWAVIVADASVWYLIVQAVRPERWVAECWRYD